MSEQLNGFLNINKPLGLTSHDVVAKIRYKAKKLTGNKKLKVGHAGTLDPAATGVLVICLGQASRLSEYAMHSTKQYRAAIRLGIVTDSYDSEGQIVRETDASQITQADVENVLPQFTGDIEQIPPMYSAIKQGGKKLYELARQGETVERAARNVTIHNLEIVSWNAPDFELLVTCSSGTYIRSLAYDIGEALGVGAYLAGLERTRSGNFRVENALDLDALLQPDVNLYPYLLPPLTALEDWQIVPVKDAQIQAIIQGRSIPIVVDVADETAVAVETDGHLLAILEKRGSLWKPHKVFIRD